MFNASLNSIWENLPQDGEIEYKLQAMGIWDANLSVESNIKRYVRYCSMDFGVATESQWPQLCRDLLEFEQGIV